MLFRMVPAVERLFIGWNLTTYKYKSEGVLISGNKAIADPSGDGLGKKDG